MDVLCPSPFFVGKTSGKALTKSPSGWWCNLTILKNDGVKVNGKDDIPYMKWKIKKKKKSSKAPTSHRCGPGSSAPGAAATAVGPPARRAPPEAAGSPVPERRGVRRPWGAGGPDAIGPRANVGLGRSFQVIQASKRMTRAG